MNDLRDDDVAPVRRPGRRGLGLLAAAVAVVGVSACGAGASKLAGTLGGGTVCHDWPGGTQVVDCAVGAMGPGGGRVFFNAGSKQSWGQFLEVAPQNWNGTLYPCPILNNQYTSCDYTYPATDGTSDLGTGSSSGPGPGYPVCSEDSTWWTSSKANTVISTQHGGQAVGDGKANTKTLLASPLCTTGKPNALTLATGYRGGGQSDWYLPSDGELTELCHYIGRVDIGGFIKPEARNYQSSTFYYAYVDPDFFTAIKQVSVGNRCETGIEGKGGHYYAVRPVRAFS